MKNILKATTLSLALLLGGCATWQTADGFEAGRLAAGALQDTAALVCEGPGFEGLTEEEKDKCENLDLAAEKAQEAIDALEAAWEDIAPVLGLPANVEAPKSEPEQPEE